MSLLPSYPPEPMNRPFIPQDRELAARGAQLKLARHALERIKELLEADEVHAARNLARKTNELLRTAERMRRQRGLA